MPNGYDLDLSQLRTYRGTGARPEDFESFWSNLLADLSSAREVNWAPAEFSAPGMEARLLCFQSHDESRIQAQVLLPENRPTTGLPVIFHFHGYSASSAQWTEMLALAAAGFAVVAMDCRGQGGGSDDAAAYPGWGLSGYLTRGMVAGPEQSYYARVYRDIVLLVRLIEEDGRFDATKMASMGGSQGGGLAVVCAALCPKITYVAAAYPFISDFRRVYEMDLARDAYDDLSAWLKRFAATGERREALFSALDYISVHHLAPMVHCPVLFAATLRDRICPPSTQYAVFNNLNGPKQLVVYPEHGHEELPGFWDQAFAHLLALADGQPLF